MSNISILFVEGDPSKNQEIPDLLRNAGYPVKQIPSSSSDISNGALEPSAEVKSAIACLTSASLLDDGLEKTPRTPIYIVAADKSRNERGPKGLLSLDNLQLNRLTHKAHVNNQEMNLTSIQFSLLNTFLENLGVVMSKAKLYQSVLNREFGPHDRSLDMHLSRLRRKLTELGWQGERLKTVHGKGYCMK